MKYTILTLGMPFNGETISQGKSLGGSESASYYVAKELAQRGHSVKVFSNIPPEMEGEWDGVQYHSAGQVDERNPLGANFMQYASMVPHDVCLIQRHPQAFSFRPNSKLNLWWTHDLAIKRQTGLINTQLPFVDRVLAVSKFHKSQLIQVYGLKKELIDVLPNGVDKSLFCHDVPVEERIKNKVMLYTSRPERGLENLVAPGGIMEQLQKKDPSITLKVCGYDNTTPQMAPKYQQLWQWCQELPNVELLGPLSKKDLAYLMSTAWLHVYPTTFEETSCITAMEEQSAGTPFMASVCGALPETLSGAGVRWIKSTKDGQVDKTGFVTSILALAKNETKWRDLHDTALGKKYSWSKSVDALEKSVKICFQEKTNNKDRVARHLLHTSDIMVCTQYAKEHGLTEIEAEIKEHYGYAFEDGFAEHYENLAKWETENGIEHGLGRDHLYEIPRFKPVLSALQSLPDGSYVLDYACGQGHFTEACARMFPNLDFIGVDVSNENIKIGRKYLKENPLKNITLISLDAFEKIEKDFDLIIAAEILEHVPEPGKLIDTLEGYCKVGGQIVTTTPFGPWEASTYETHPYRMHLHHLEEQDLNDLFGNKPGYQHLYVPSSPTQSGEPLGCFACRWKVEENQLPSGKVDYKRKVNQQAPKETLSVCMIIKPDGKTLAKTLESVKLFADEIVISIDEGKKEHGRKEGRVWDIAKEYKAKAFAGESPLDIGFDEARNATIQKATGDWVLWIDDDEDFTWSERMVKYLRPNNFDSYAIPQHHFSAEPAGVIKTDYPCRIFRRNSDTRFYGRVHEHPEKGGMNEGCGATFLIQDVAICHNGYSTEDVRRARFIRNLPLMRKDREDYPKRRLGIMLWIRDLAHRCRYELEATGQMSQQILDFSKEAIGLWRELLAETKDVRLAVDSLPYYSECVQHLTQGHGINFAHTFGVNFMGMGNMNGNPPEPVKGIFENKADIELFSKAVTNENLKFLDGGVYL
jgi:2-polyprenyl-3-methyl-5-hydroxy-6-metoxy-1,4-benzoquinol methylase/glycosyltransferase involved in cell wall biosynthesis